MQPSPAEHLHLIEDVLRPGLRVVFCGTALGRTSAEAKAYYAHKQNLFWTTLHEVGLTTAGRPLMPSEYSRATEFGIGLTDLCKHAFGNDNELPRGAFDITFASVGQLYDYRQGVAPEAAALIAYPGGHIEGFPDTFRALFSQVYQDVMAGRPSPKPAYPTFSDGHDAVLVTDAVAQSNDEQRWVTIQR